MRPRQFLALVCLAALMLSACADANPQQVNRAAQVILTRSAEQGVVSPTRPTTDPNVPQPTLGVVTATPSLIYALCIVREPTELRPQPDAAIAPVADLTAREIITAYGRTADVQWVLAWNKDRTYGWVTSGLVGCTVPTAELFPTAPDALAAQPAAVAVAPVEAATPTEVPAAPTATTPAEAATPTEVPAAPTATPPVEAATPTEVPAPVAAAPTPIIIIQIVTVVVTVTAAPAEPAVVATLAPTAGPTLVPSPTFAPTTTPVTPAAPPAASPTPVDSECVVTPGTPVNVRRGPGRTERLLGALPEGATFVAFGRNEDATWLYGATARRTFGWLIASAVACQTDVQLLPVVDR